MFDQKVLFRTMLASLAVAALLGVVAVLMASYEVVGRVIVTAFLTSGVAALLWQAASRLERSESSIWIAQAGGLIFYLFALCGIWEIGQAWDMWGTGLVVLLCSAVAAGGWSLNAKPEHHHTGYVAAGISVVVGACCLWGIWIEYLSQEMWTTGFAVLGWSSAAAVCLVGLGYEPARHWRWIGVVAAAVGLALSEYAIFSEVHADWLGKTVFIVGTTVAAVLHAVLCYSSRIAPAKLTIRNVAIASTIATVALLDVLCLQDIREDHFLMRVAIAAAIVASTSTIATAFIIQSYWRQARRESLGREVGTSAARLSTYASLHIECPKCRHQGEFSVGDSNCPGCGLRFHIEIDEPAHSRMHAWTPAEQQIPSANEMNLTSAVN